MPISAPLPISVGASTLSRTVASALLRAAVSFEQDVVKALISDVMLAVVSATTSVSPAEGNSWFNSVAHGLFPVEVLVVTPLLFAATIGAIFRQDMRRLARAWGVSLPLSIIGGYAIVNLVYMGLHVTDAMSSIIQDEVAPHLQTEFAGVIAGGLAGPGATEPLNVVLSLVVIAGGVAIWLELILRSAAVELSVFFMPLALAGLVWPATAHWARRLSEVLGALLLAKPVVVGALCLGTSALASAKAGPSSIVTGAGILLMAAFAPMVLLKLVPVVEVSAIAHLEGVSRRPFHAAERVGQRALAIAASSGGAAAGGAAGGGGAPGGAGVGSAGQLLSQVGQGSGAAQNPLGPAGPPGPEAGGAFVGESRSVGRDA